MASVNMKFQKPFSEGTKKNKMTTVLLFIVSNPPNKSCFRAKSQCSSISRIVEITNINLKTRNNKENHRKSIIFP
ncbi:hypothetical protein PRUPE_6G269900 [Prunus persica]|uniref:Uncharacterized protein n=1 Tax=Prunus persica TaxID=3760 RepID=A0A251NWG2_PRUPE|nr:hypothetical protein PRUPE_6G269900 [Prunus persica]